MKLLLWNVNGLRAISKKEVGTDTNFQSFIKPFDIVVLNETKIGETQMNECSGLFSDHKYAYHSYSTTKKGYSGVSIVSKIEPISRIYPPFEDDEGRLVILEFESFILVGVYVPNAENADKSTKLPVRLTRRTEVWDKQFRSMCSELEKRKSLIILGDLNVAHMDVDVYAPSRLGHHAGFTKQERENFGRLLNTTTLVDTWRLKHPTKIEYSYFDYRTKARSRNVGWRIDYALISKDIYESVKTCEIITAAHGSDHLPLKLILK